MFYNRKEFSFMRPAKTTIWLAILFLVTASEGHLFSSLRKLPENNQQQSLQILPFQDNSQLSLPNPIKTPVLLSNQEFDQNPKVLSPKALSIHQQLLRLATFATKHSIRVKSSETSTSNEQASYSAGNIRYQQLTQAAKWRVFSQPFISSIDQNKLLEEQYQYYQRKYNIGSFNELPFCIVVPTYNNFAQNRYLKNMMSIVMQNYSNYHIVVIDDGSTDETGEHITNFLLKQTKIPPEKYYIERNAQQKKAMPNLRRAAMSLCHPEEIFLIIDGDDQLIGRQVLKLFNDYFQTTQAWFVYSNFVHQQLSTGYSRPYPQGVTKSNSYRSYPFVTSHLRAFYTQLFRNIKEEDLKDQQGNYFKAANDVAICFPVLEQSHTHVAYLPEVTYYYNSNTGQNNHFIRAHEQRSNQNKVRRKQPYTPLQELKFDDH